MQLKTLEIKGFKSFGDKVVIHFNQGVTGIVGPNGCGKSNIVDAIRWVLGEQKLRNLRSDKMESVIFNGTKSRKAQQMAEVSLTFENTKNILPTEYSTVQISRRYYRSGESEYLLNGVNCRHKDIQNLFMDTGIGSDSYAIIELKMVEDLLNDRDDSRRGLFEEAAGISKFKQRKKESLRKLEDTDKDLERVEDLLHEISRNLKSLEKQAKQAEQYFSIKEEYKAASIQLAQFSIFARQESLRKVKQDVDEIVNNRTQLSAQSAQAEASLADTKQKLLQAEKLLQSRQKALNDHVNQIRNYESEKRVKDEQIRLLTQKSTSLSSALAETEQLLPSTRLRIETLESDIKMMQVEIEGLQSNVNLQKATVEADKAKLGELQTQLNEANKQFRLQQDAAFRIKNSVDINKMQLQSLKREYDQTAGDTQTQSAALETFDTKQKEVEQKLSITGKQLESIKEADKALDEKIEQNRLETEQVREQLVKLNREYDAKNGEFQLTKSFIDNMEGYPEALRYLKKNNQWISNTPVISDIISCEEPYKVAIETYLENLLNYFVVEDEEEALQGINLLGKAGKGRANFFVLNRFEDREVNYAPSFPNAVYAPDIVEFDPKYKNLVLNLLGGVFIVSDNTLPEHPDFIFIAQSGNITKKRYSLSGGSVGIFEGKTLGRAKNLAKLQKQLEQLSIQIEKCRNTLSKLQSESIDLKKQDRKADIRKEEQVFNLLQQELVAIKTKGEQTAQFILSANNRQQTLADKITSLEKEIAENEPKLGGEEGRLQELESEISRLTSLAKEANESFNAGNSLFQQENTKLIQKENGLKIKQQELLFKQSELNSHLDKIERSKNDLNDTDNEIRQILSRSNEKDDDLVALYNEKKTIETGVNEAEVAYYQIRELIEISEKALKEIAANKDRNEILYNELNQSANELKIEAQNTVNRISIEFGIDLEELDTDNFDGGLYSEDELKDRVKNHRNRLEKIGPINPMALEAFQEMKERFDFITAQKKDLVEAKDSLTETISEIENVAKTTFMETFNKIRENFIMVFRSLFTEEDSCDLQLVNPSQPLESAIEIVAKPKGKRPASINQLSGGEKTLTAISLLFAIYLVKPAPFCIFDEVDAPLDDANIDKFNNIIRKFSADSQFIIVTHNKRTMSATDVMYGITMLEQGVSRAIPVDLRTLPV